MEVVTYWIDRFRFCLASKLGLVTPIEQFMTVSGGISALVYSGSNFYNVHVLSRFTEGTRVKICPLTMEVVTYWINRFRFRGFATLGAYSLFVAYLWSRKKVGIKS